MPPKTSYKHNLCFDVRVTLTIQIFAAGTCSLLVKVAVGHERRGAENAQSLRQRLHRLNSTSLSSLNSTSFSAKHRKSRLVLHARSTGGEAEDGELYVGSGELLALALVRRRVLEQVF